MRGHRTLFTLCVALTAPFLLTACFLFEKDKKEQTECKPACEEGFVCLSDTWECIPLCEQHSDCASNCCLRLSDGRHACVPLGNPLIEHCQQEEVQDEPDGGIEDGGDEGGDQASGEAVIGPGGGRVDHPAGASVVIPSGALDSDTLISIDDDADGYPQTPAGYAVTGQVWAFTPHGLTFSSPVTIHVPVSGNPPNADLYTASPGGSWEPVAVAQNVGGAFEADVTHFSFFAPMAQSCGNGQVDPGEDCDGSNPPHSTCTNCSLSCSSGYDDCDGNAANGCEAQVASDANNCGECLHACESGSCSQGLCAPVVLAETGAGDEPGTLSQDADYIYFSTAGGSIMRVSKTGGGLETLSSGHGCFCDLDVAGSTVYFTASGEETVYSVPAGGGYAQAIATGQPQPWWIASDGSTVLFTYSGSVAGNYLDGDVKAVPASGGTATVVALGQMTPHGITTVGSTVYFSIRNSSPGGADEILRMSTSGAGLTAIASFASDTDDPSKVVVVGNWVYWVDRNAGIYRVQTGGTGLTQLVPGAGVRMLTADDQRIYFTTYDYVYYKNLTGGGLVQLFESIATSPYDIEVDDDAIYWSDDSGSGRIYKLPKADMP